MKQNKKTTALLKQINDINIFSTKKLLVFGFVFIAIGMLIIRSYAANPNLLGDLNDNNKVDIADLSILLSNFGTTNQIANLDSNPLINITDLSILLTNYGKTYTAPPPTVSFSANPSSISTGSFSTLSWNSINADSCNASGGWAGNKPINGSQQVTPSLTTVYNLMCTGAGGNKSVSVTVTVATAGNETATELECPNQTNSAAATTTKYAAMICMTTHARKFNRLGPVSQSTPLMSAATAKSNDIVSCNQFSHTACGRNFDYWIKFYSYSGRCYGENIAQGYPTVRSTFIAWMNSAGHRANILNESYKDIGVGIASGNTWTMELGGC